MDLRKSKLQKGDVLHCTGQGFVARAIRLFTRSRVNHTAIVIEVWNELFIIDSQADGTNLRPIKEWNDKYNYSYIIHRPKTFTTQQREKAVSVIGTTPYDFKSLLWYQPVYILTGKWKGKRYDAAAEKLYCSEYVAWLFDMPGWWKASPEAVKNWMDDHKGFTRINL